jgi:hypothetical protein
MTEIIFNPDILPTKKEWLLICKMVKQQPKLTDEEIEDVQKQFYTTTTHHDKDFARAILKKASAK